MKFSAVIPHYKERTTIRAIVDADRASHVPGKELILVDDCSTDGTIDILRKELAPLVGAVSYDPHEYGRLLDPIVDGRINVSSWLVFHRQPVAPGSLLVALDGQQRTDVVSRTC